MVQIENLPLILTGLSITISIIYYASVLRNQNKTREAQLFMQLFGRYSREAWRDGYELLQMEWTNMDDFFHKYDSSVNMDNFEKRYKLWSFLMG